MAVASVEELSTQDLLTAARGHGKKLAFLIAAMNLKDEEKEAMINLLPAMSLEQLERLEATLEMQYLESKTAHLNAEAGETLELIQQQYEAEMAKLEKDTADALNNIQA